MLTWYEKAEDQIDRELADGLIDAKEHAHQLRELRAEVRAEAEEAAERAYNDVMGGW